jgi:hypothetical protein
MGFAEYIETRAVLARRRADAVHVEDYALANAFDDLIHELEHPIARCFVAAPAVQTSLDLVLA